MGKLSIYIPASRKINLAYLQSSQLVVARCSPQARWSLRQDVWALSACIDRGTVVISIRYFDHFTFVSFFLRKPLSWFS